MKLEFFVEWASTIILIVGVALTSWDIYPANVYVCLVANLMWLWLGFIWRKWSLIIVELVVIAIYISGVVKVLTA